MELPGVELRDVSAVIDDSLTRDAWVYALREVGRLAKGSPWWLGDLFIGGQAVWGKGYAKVAAREAGVTPATVVAYASTSSKVSPAVRRPELSHAHHREVESERDPEEQAWWLEYAVRHDLTVAEFRRARGRGKTQTPPEPETFTADELDLCPTCGRPVSA